MDAEQPRHASVGGQTAFVDGDDEYGNACKNGQRLVPVDSKTIG
jgi:hypothetical protein